MDMYEIANLFHIFKSAHEHGDQFKNIRDQAFQRLKEIDADHGRPDQTSTDSNDEPANEPGDPGADDDHDGRRV